MPPRGTAGRGDRGAAALEALVAPLRFAARHGFAGASRFAGFGGFLESEDEDNEKNDPDL